MSLTPKILVVDNDTQPLATLQRLFATFNIEVVTAISAEEVLQRITEYQFVFALFDVAIAQQNDFQPVKLLRNHYHTKHLPIILVSDADFELAQKVSGYEAGATDFLTKPIIPEALLSKTRIFLDLYQQRAELEGLIEIINDDTESLERQIWERLQTEVALNEANQALLKLNADKDKFFSIVAHDLKGPFLPVLGNAELLAEMADTLPAADITEISLSIHRSGKRVLNLLESLLQWSRLQMGRMEYQPEQFTLKTVADEIVILLEDVAQNKQVNLLNTVDETISVYADQHMLDTVIRNLTNNALKFTKPDGSVTIAAQRNGHLTEIAVADTGVGMSESHRQKLFRTDTHVTTSGTANETGTGLGLIICQEMVEMNGGHIWVESELGVGTTVKFTLPQTAADVVLPDEDTTTEEAPDLTIEYPSKRSGVAKIIHLSDQVNLSAKRIYDLLDAVLNWVKRDLQTIDHAPKQVSVGELIETTLQRVAKQAEHKMVSLQTEVVEGLYVFSDHEQLEAILYGLLNNAIKFTPSGKQVTLTAQLRSLDERGQVVEFAIVDKGRGLHNRETMQLFTNYIYQKLSGEFLQTQAGLGLMIYQELVRRNGGHLWVDSDPQHGTTVCFTIPSPTQLPA